jgi:TrfA protein
MKKGYSVSDATEAAATKGVKSIPSLDDLHQRTKEIVERARRDEEERLETGVVQLPLWHDDKRGAPNSFLRSALFAAIQSKDRADLKKAELFSQQGITVTYTGQQLNQEDLTVWLALVDLMKKDPLGTQCHFTAYSILKHLGLGTGGSAHERLNDAILRMTACAVVIKTGRQTYMGSLIHDCLIDEQTKHYKITLNRHLIKLFGEDDWTAIDWEQRKQLRQKPLCLKLHEYYSSHDKPLPISLEFLSALTGSENKQKADFKRKVKTALEGLIKIGFLKGYEIESDVVKVERVPKPCKHLSACLY